VKTGAILSARTWSGVRADKMAQVPLPCWQRGLILDDSSKLGSLPTAWAEPTPNATATDSCDPGVPASVTSPRPGVRL